MIRKTLLLSLLAIVFWLPQSFAQKEAKLLRFPTIHGDQVVFSFAGDLYTVKTDGGVARRLTADPNGYELFAHFSPDGKNIAFTAQYDGNTEVYCMPADGGHPQRLTFTPTLDRDEVSDRMGPNNIVMGWKGNDTVVFRSRMKSFNSFKGKLYLISTEGGLPKELPLPSGGFNSFSPDQQKLAFNRVFREFRTWKYYQGGMADNVWVFDMNTKETVKITDNIHQNIFPMWKDNKIYFLSDRDRTMNLFAYDMDTKKETKLTDYTEYDMKYPTLGDDAIVYENGGLLFRYILSSGEIKPIPVKIADDALAGRMPFKELGKKIASWSVSPDGKRAAFNARGEVFTVPAEEGVTYQLTSNAAANSRDVKWSPDGKYIAYISDDTGENEIYIINQDGSEPAVKLTTDSKTYIYDIYWSPDSKKIAFHDKKGTLKYVDVKSKEITEVYKSNYGEVDDYSWAPDSKWIAYSVPSKGRISYIDIYNLDTKESKQVTSSYYYSSSPAFDSDGKYLFFVSARDFNPIYSWTEWNHAYQDMNRVYFVGLTKDAKSPFAPKNDLVKVEDKDKKDDKKKDKKKDKKEESESKEVKIDFDGIVDRIQVIPVSPGYYYDINAIGNKVYFCKFSNSSDKNGLFLYNMEKEKETYLGAYYSYEVSANNEKMMLGGSKYAIIDLPASKIDASDKNMKLDGIEMFVDLDKEYHQLFNEAWRVFRDFFYAPNMHGVDWDKIKAKYEPLVEYAKNRHDLNYIIGEMIAEVNVGHAYVNGGDIPKPKRIRTGLLGAELSRDASGYYKIDKILSGENWTKKSRSPFTEPGVKVSEGDYIIAVNGKSLKEEDNIYKLLVDKANKLTELTINSKADPEGSHKVVIKPIADQAGLYYYNWVKGNIDKVNKATDGQVGYIHIPDMGPEGLNEFVKLFYPQLNKKALIIDDRGNGGGNVSPMIIERLNRKLAMITKPRDFEGEVKPFEMLNGPMVLLINNYSASDGDLFPYQFKKLKIGTVIGIRSWGGVVGIRGPRPFVDGMDLRVPEFGPYNNEGTKWIIEGHGVEPDIEIDNDPYKEYIGEDQQLNKAIEVIKEQLKDWKPLPTHPEYPNKTK